MIVKNLDSSAAWIVGSQELTSSSYIIVFNGDGAEYTSTNKFSEEAPTASVVILGDADETNKDTESFISYCFHSVEGYSKIGSYVGTSDNDGPFIYCGFKPAYLLVRAIDSGQQWGVYDNARDAYNVMDEILYPNLAAAAGTGSVYYVDFVSNGFKWRGDNATMNYTGINYMYYAVAESPFKTSNAR